MIQKNRARAPLWRPVLLAALLALAGAPPAFAAGERLDDPGFRLTAPVTLAVARIVIRNDQRQRQARSAGRLDAGRGPADLVERYLRTRLRADGGAGPQLLIVIRKAEILNQGRTDLGRTREYINIGLDMALSANEFLTTQKRSHVEVKRSTAGTGARLGSLPVDSRHDTMEEVIKILDRRLLEALRYELKVLP